MAWEAADLLVQILEDFGAVAIEHRRPERLKVGDLLAESRIRNAANRWHQKKPQVRKRLMARAKEKYWEEKIDRGARHRLAKARDRQAAE